MRPRDRRTYPTAATGSKKLTNSRGTLKDPDHEEKGDRRGEDKQEFFGESLRGSTSVLGDEFPDEAPTASCSSCRSAPSTSTTPSSRIASTSPRGQKQVGQWRCSTTTSSTSEVFKPAGHGAKGGAVGTRRPEDPRAVAEGTVGEAGRGGGRCLWLSALRCGRCGPATEVPAWTTARRLLSEMTSS